MENIIIIISVLSILSLVFIIHGLLGTIKDMSKLIKASNLGEFVVNEGEQEKNVEIENKRYKEIGELSDDELVDLKIKPENFN